MALNRISGLVVAGLVSVGLAFSVSAQDVDEPPATPLTPEEAVEVRQAMMNSNGMVMRGAGRATGAEAIAAMETMRENFAAMPGLFPEGSIVGRSDALPAIWENWDVFVAIAETGVSAAEDAIAAAEAGDGAAYTAAFRVIAGTCNQCHQQFRR